MPLCTYPPSGASFSKAFKGCFEPRGALPSHHQSHLCFDFCLLLCPTAVKEEPAFPQSFTQHHNHKPSRLPQCSPCWRCASMPEADPLLTRCPCVSLGAARPLGTLACFLLSSLMSLSLVTFLVQWREHTIGTHHLRWPSLLPPQSILSRR